MTSYEIVRRAIEFERPERIPIRFAALGLDDTHWAGIGPAAGWRPSQPNADEWGCVWETPPEASGVVNMGQPTGHPLSSLDDIDQVPWPDPTDDARYEATARDLKGAGDKYVLASSAFTLFERMHFLHGMPDL